MQVETTIQRMFDNFPMLFSTRQECYDHLFCVIGNGYRWWHGQLVDERPFVCDKKEREALLEMNDRDYCREVPRAEQSEENARKKQERDRQTMDFLLRRKAEGANPFISPKWYPLSRKYSALFNVPEDVKPDWAAAVGECKRMLIADGVWKEQQEENSNEAKDKTA